MYSCTDFLISALSLLGEGSGSLGLGMNNSSCWITTIGHSRQTLCISGWSVWFESKEESMHASIVLHYSNAPEDTALLYTTVVNKVAYLALSTYPTPPKFWKRYVDDTCTALPKESLLEFHKYLNSVNQHIQFTVEQEEGGILPFLDMLLSRDQDGSITTSVYRKSTHTDRYLNFLSHHPLTHKRSVVNTLFKRAEELSSDTKSQSEEERHLRITLKRNGYLRQFVKRSRMNVRTLARKDEDVDRDRKLTVTLSYIRSVSESLKRMLEEVDVRVRM